MREEIRTFIDGWKDSPQQIRDSFVQYCPLSVVRGQLSVAIKLFSLCYGRLAIPEEKEDE